MELYFTHAFCPRLIKYVNHDNRFLFFFKQKMLRAFGLFAGSIFLMRNFGELMAIWRHIWKYWFPYLLWLCSRLWMVILHLVFSNLPQGIAVSLADVFLYGLDFSCSNFTTISNRLWCSMLCCIIVSFSYFNSCIYNVLVA